MNRFCALLALLLLAACTPSVYDAPYPVGPITLPRDDAAHDAPIEWWYYTGHLQTPEDEELGFELALFKAFLPPSIRLFGVYPLYNTVERGHVGHFALSDPQQKRFVMGERSDFALYEGSASQEKLDVRVANWSVTRADDGVSHRIRASEAGTAIDLTLTPLKRAVLHGSPPGIQSMGPGGTSYYVSYTRMEVSGTLKRGCGFLGLGCETLEVTGEAWSDHQWGDFDLSSYAGWDWFSVQFNDDTELMLYFIRAPDGSYLEEAGSFITPDGRTLPLKNEDITLTALGETWTSPQTGAIYPMRWRVVVPKHDLDLTVTPTFPEQEMDTRASTGIVYWEGSVRVTGTREGVGYVELTNYDRYPYGQTDADTPLQPMRGPF
jgi:predicted secreted hydrolase